MSTSTMLIHIGYPKASSTFLQERLFHSTALGFWPIFPEKADRIRLNELLVHLPALAFDPAPLLRVVQARIDLRQVDGLVPVISAESMVGMPIDALGGSSKAVADRISATFPNARVLVIFREQSSMILSRYYQYVRGGGVRSLDRFVRSPAETGTGGRWIGAYLPFFEYDRLVGYYQEKLGPDRVLALPFELLRRDARDYIIRIAKFAGANTDPDKVDLSVVKEGIPANIIGIRRVANAVISVDADNPFSYLMPDALYWRVARYPKRWIDAVGRRFDDRASKVRFKKRLDRRLGDYYTRSNRRLAEMTGIDLKALGYRI